MRRFLIIGVMILAAIAASLLAWWPGVLTQEKWIRHAMQQLRQTPPPPAGLASSPGGGEWAGQGYLLFTNGWACFTSHTVHSSGRVGDIGLLRASDGSFYISHFHFCVGLDEYSQQVHPPEQRQARPRDIGHFIELYGQTHGWTRIPGA